MARNSESANQGANVKRLFDVSECNAQRRGSLCLPICQGIPFAPRGFGRKIGLNWQFLCDDHDAGHRHTVNATGNLAPLKTRSRRPLGLVGNSLASELFIDKNHPCFGVPNSSQQCKATLDLEATLTLMVWFGFGRRDCVYGISTLMHPE